MERGKDHVLKQIERIDAELASERKRSEVRVLSRSAHSKSQRLPTNFPTPKPSNFPPQRTSHSGLHFRPDGVRFSPPNSPLSPKHTLESFPALTPVSSPKEEIERQMDLLAQRIKSIDFITLPHKKRLKKKEETGEFHCDFARSVHNPSEIAASPVKTVPVTSETILELAQTIDKRVLLKSKRQLTKTNRFDGFSSRD